MAGHPIFTYAFTLAVILLAMVSLSTCVVLGSSASDAHNIISLDTNSAIELDSGFNNHQKSSLVNRPATFKEAKCKGEILLNGIKSGNYPESTWKNYASLEHEGWTGGIIGGNREIKYIDKMMKALAFDNKIFSLYEHKSKTEKCDARYASYFHTKGGLAVPYESFHYRSNNGALARASDVIWLQWKHACENAGLDPKTLSYVLSYAVTNEVSDKIAKEALVKRNQEAIFTEWPGTNFLMSTDEGKAILGSPNGYGIGFMLLQHGIKKTIESVTVFDNDVGGSLNLLFHLK